MSEHAPKCENNAIFKQNYTLELFIALIMLLFGLKGKSRFSRFPPKKFYNINYWSHFVVVDFFKLNTFFPEHEILLKIPGREDMPPADPGLIHEEDSPHSGPDFGSGFDHQRAQGCRRRCRCT